MTEEKIETYCIQARRVDKDRWNCYFLVLGYPEVDPFAAFMRINEESSRWLLHLDTTKATVFSLPVVAELSAVATHIMTAPEPEPEEPAFDPSKLRHGLYIIFWKSGGESLASVGSYHDGARWFAPTNWLHVPSVEWERVGSVSMVRPQ